MTVTDLARSWAECLAADAALAAFVADHGERPLTVLLGFDEAREFGAADCPYVAVQPVDETGGPEAEERGYSVAFYLGFTVDKKAVLESGVLTQPGVTLMASYATAVMTALEDHEAPPLRGDIRHWPPVNGYVETHIMATYNEDQPLHVRNAWA